MRTKDKSNNANNFWLNLILKNKIAGNIKIVINIKLNANKPVHRRHHSTCRRSGAVAV